MNQRRLICDLTNNLSTKQSGTGEEAALGKAWKGGTWHLRGMEKHQCGFSVMETGKPQNGGGDSRPGWARPRCIPGQQLPQGHVVHEAHVTSVLHSWWCSCGRSLERALTFAMRLTSTVWKGKGAYCRCHDEPQEVLVI